MINKDEPKSIPFGGLDKIPGWIFWPTYIALVLLVAIGLANLTIWILEMGS